MRDNLVTLFLCGDVMTGRGVDQILPRPGDPRLWEGYIRDARMYVELAEQASGRIPRRVDFSWPWGDAGRVLDQVGPDVRIVNLETSITRSDDAASGKAVLYRMHPDNVPCLTATRLDVCTLANNHVLDFGYRGLDETLGSLRTAGVTAVGAGGAADEAERPAVVRTEAGGRVVVGSYGMASSGVPRKWAATADRPGVDYLRDLSPAAAEATADRLRRVCGPGDVAVASIHWGSNWGYEVFPDQVDFARRLVDGGVDVVYGHSSHHPRPIEVYRGKLILYGCGDFIDDYEGITGHEEYRDDLRVMYFPSLERGTGRLAELRMAVMQAHRMRLRPASPDDSAWLRDVLDEVSRPFGARIELAPDGMLRVPGRA